MAFKMNLKELYLLLRLLHNFQKSFGNDITVDMVQDVVYEKIDELEKLE